MKAAIYHQSGGPEVLQYAEVADPVIGPDEVLVAVEAISIEGGDLINRRMTAPTAPGILGYAAAGTVVSVGDAVVERQVGDRVTTFGMQGSHAALRRVPVNQTWLIPDNVDFESAAALPISFGTAYHCLFSRAALQSGETVLVMGAAGGVGLAAIQLVKLAGASVLAVSSGEERLRRLRSIADRVIDRHNEDIVEVVSNTTYGEGVNVVIDPVGSTLPTSIMALSPGGRLVFVGNAGGEGLNVDLWSAMQANQSLLGVFMGTQLTHPDVRATIEEMLDNVAKGALNVPIARRFSLQHAVDAHHYAESGKPFGRVIMHP